MSATTTTTASELYEYHLSTTDQWDQYIEHRPPYPDSMFEKWLAFHGENEPLSAVHDLGTGGGVGTLAFLKALPRLRGTNPIQNMYLSDPGVVNIEAARRNLTPQRFPGVSFHFHQGAGEHGNPDIAPGSLDMVMACECLHWTEIEPTMAHIARSLRPGGTFAGVLYLAIPRLTSSAQAAQRQQAFERAWRTIATRRGTLWSVYHTLQACMGLDFVPLDRELWADRPRLRWYCNVTNREWPMEELMCIYSRETIEQNRPKNWAVVDKEAGLGTEEVVTDRDNWGMRDMTAEKLKQIYLARQPGAFDDFTDLPEWKALEEEIDRLGGKVDGEVPAVMVLAKKK